MSACRSEGRSTAEQFSRLRIHVSILLMIRRMRLPYKRSYIGSRQPGMPPGGLVGALSNLISMLGRSQTVISRNVPKGHSECLYPQGWQDGGAGLRTRQFMTGVAIHAARNSRTGWGGWTNRSFLVEIWSRSHTRCEGRGDRSVSRHTAPCESLWKIQCPSGPDYNCSGG